MVAVSDGLVVGPFVGARVGPTVGESVGISVGATVGALVGFVVGESSPVATADTEQELSRLVGEGTFIERKRY